MRAISDCQVMANQNCKPRLSDAEADANKSSEHIISRSIPSKQHLTILERPARCIRDYLFINCHDNVQ